MKDVLSSSRCAEVLRALADADRLRLVQCLRDRAHSVGELATAVGAEIANVSHHLQILKRTGIVLTEKQGRHVIYRLHPDVYRVGTATGDQLDFGCCQLGLPREPVIEPLRSKDARKTE